MRPARSQRQDLWQAVEHDEAQRQQDHGQTQEVANVEPEEADPPADEDEV